MQGIFFLYEKSLKELFDMVAPSDVRPDFMATPVKQNNLPIKEYESAIFYSGIAKGLVEGCLLKRDREAYSHITDQ
ncbi:hypothetical protein MKX01_028939, partial [Papaver californicum]